MSRNRIYQTGRRGRPCLSWRCWSPGPVRTARLGIRSSDQHHIESKSFRCFLYEWGLFRDVSVESKSFQCFSHESATLWRNHGMSSRFWPSEFAISQMSRDRICQTSWNRIWRHAPALRDVLIGKKFQFKNCLAMKFTARMLFYRL